jgi:Flp pilus assembly protein TadD
MRHAANGRYSAAIGCFEKALAERPDDTQALFALAGTARDLSMFDAAENFYDRVLALEPGRLEAVVCLANLKRARGKYDESEALLTAALTADGDAPELWLTMGSTRREAGDDAKAAACYREALARRPDYTPALANLAEILADRGKPTEALELYDRVLRAEPGNPRARLNRAIIHLLTGDFEKGWRDYAARLDLATAPRPDHGLPRWSGAFRPGEKLLVTAEQGVGDQIMFASLLPDMAALAKANGAKLIVECEPRLTNLFARSFSSVLVHESDMRTSGGRNYASYGWLANLGGADAFAEMGTLPAFLRKCREDFRPHESFLVPDEDERARWRDVFSELPRPLIGVCWRSGKTGGGRTRLYASPSEWAAFIRDLPGTPVSAQYDAGNEEIAFFEQTSGRRIFVPPALDQKSELDRTAAMLGTLDAVVSAPTAVSWLAAAVGVDTAKIFGSPGWTNFGASYEPFAPKAVCFIPELAGDWPAAFAAAKQFLARKFG